MFFLRLLHVYLLVLNVLVNIYIYNIILYIYIYYTHNLYYDPEADRIWMFKDIIFLHVYWVFFEFYSIYSRYVVLFFDPICDDDSEGPSKKLGEYQVDFVDLTTYPAFL